MISDCALFLSAAIGFTASIGMVAAAVFAVKRVIDRQHQARRSHLRAGAAAPLSERTCRVAP